MADIKQSATIVGIMILSALFIIFAVDAFYPEPKRDDYCQDEIYSRPIMPIETTNKCDDVYNSEEAIQCNKDKGVPRLKTVDNCSVFDFCDFCDKDFTNAREKHSRNSFFIIAPLGIIMIVIGAFYSVAFIGSGFMFGGIIVLAYSTIRYFSDLNKILRVFILLVELLILVWLGVKKIKK